MALSEAESQTQQTYHCDSKQSAIECKSCKEELGIRISHQIDFKRKVVIIKKYNNGIKFDEDLLLENCKFTDQNNWKCGEGISFNEESNIYAEMDQGMVDGIYYSVSIIKQPSFKELNLPAYNMQSYYCAK